MADPVIGGAILGEACHFVNLTYWLLESEPLRNARRTVQSAAAAAFTELTRALSDNTIGRVKFSMEANRLRGQRDGRKCLPAILEWTWNGLTALPLLVALALVPEGEARAYTDPGTGALIWQLLAAGFVGLLFYFRRFTSWLRTRKKDTKE